MPITFYPDPSNLTYSDVKSPGELDLLNKFYEYRNEADWTVIHSLHIKEHVAQSLGEADVVIAIPTIGFLIIEVKYHKEIRFDPVTGIWKMGKDKPQKESPFLQLRENRISFQNNIKKIYPSLKNIFCWELLVFNRINKITSQYEFNKEDYIGYDDFKLEGIKFLNLFSESLRKKKEKELSKPSLFFIGKDLPDKSQMALFNEIRKPIHVRMTSEIRKEILIKDLAKVFTQNQLYLYNHIKNNNRLFIEGPSGTGKTLLAIEAAKNANEQKIKTLFLCFNSLLGNYLKELMKDLNNIHVSTKIEYFRKIINDKSKIDKNDVHYNKKLNQNVIDFIINHNESIEKFDQIILDEAQDILDQETVDILDLILKKGLKNGYFSFFGDFEFQNVQNRELIDINDFKSKFDPLEFKLKENCRNIPDMISTARFYCDYNPYEKILRKDENSEPIIIKYTNEIEMCKKIDDLIEHLIKQNFKLDEISVLTIKSKHSSFFNEVIELNAQKNAEFGLNISKFKYIKNKKLNFHTIREFKGMENNAIIIIELEKLKNDLDKQLLHIGMTRALEKLCLVHSNTFKP